MSRGWKILIGVLAALVVLIGINAFVTGAETKSARVTEPDGRIVRLSGGDLEIVDKGLPTGSPIVLVHCFTCAIDWWDGMMPRLARRHRVVAVDLLGHGGSEKPSSGYDVEHQADVVAEALNRLGVRDAVLVGHSLGGNVVVALAQQSPELADRVVIVDTPPGPEAGDLGLLAKLAFAPVIGDALWRVKPDFSIRQGLEVAFAPGFEVPDEFVDDVKQMTYNAYDQSHDASDDYKRDRPLDLRMRETGKPLLVMMGSEEQIVDEPAARLAEFRETVPGVMTKVIEGAGHSPNVERPAEVAAMVLAFAQPNTPANRGNRARRVQDDVQKRKAVRRRP